MADFVEQCFQTYPQYGDDAGGLQMKIKTFTAGLSDYDLPEISYAFRHWLKENPKMPVPSEIGFIAREHRKHLAQGPVKANRPVTQNVNVVPWCGLTWQQIQDQGFTAKIEQHLVELTRLKGKEHAEGYLRYLKNGIKGAKV